MDAKLIKELKRGTLELIILSQLEHQAQYGYQLVGEITRNSGGALDVVEGSLYPVLYRLEDSGLIEANWETHEKRGLPRKYYNITPEGKDRLEELKKNWLSYVQAVEKLLSRPG